ncbi:MAG TPA: protease inhibitor I42 family protein [Chloroflexota bacterium]|jgi:predicted secreted protein
MQFDEQRNGDQVDLNSGTQFDVSLAEQPTTGFRWHVVDSGEPACHLSGDTFDANGSRHGASGVRVLHFETVEPGEGEIQLAYRRAWETDAAPARQFMLRVRVSSKNR